MTELMAGPLGLIVVAAVMWWGTMFMRFLSRLMGNNSSYRVGGIVVHPVRFPCFV